MKKSAAKKKTASPKKKPSKAEERFTRDLLVRGEAAYPDAEGKLPTEATHEIVKGTENDGELPEVRRRRFKIF